MACALPGPGVRHLVRVPPTQLVPVNTAFSELMAVRGEGCADACRFAGWSDVEHERANLKLPYFIACPLAKPNACNHRRQNGVRKFTVV